MKRGDLFGTWHLDGRWPLLLWFSTHATSVLGARSTQSRTRVADREHPCKSVRESVTVRHFEEARFARRSFALAAASVAL